MKQYVQHGDTDTCEHSLNVVKQKAVEHFDIGGKEQQIIRSHMWPLTLLPVPGNREAWIVCLADKICTMKETVGIDKKGL